MKKIDMISKFCYYLDEYGKYQVRVIPIRFRVRLDDDSEPQVIVIDRVISIEEDNRKGDKKLIFECESLINNLNRRYIIKYQLSATTWILFKM